MQAWAVRPSPGGAQGTPGVPQEPLGAALAKLGADLVGGKVMRYWPENGGWWEALVTEFSAAQQQHKLSYDPNTSLESFEWVDFRDLAPSEIKQHPSWPVQTVAPETDQVRSTQNYPCSCPCLVIISGIFPCLLE